jgi:hypothetical protein
MRMTYSAGPSRTFSEHVRILVSLILLAGQCQGPLFETAPELTNRFKVRSYDRAMTGSARCSSKKLPSQAAHGHQTSSNSRGTESVKAKDSVNDN